MPYKFGEYVSTYVDPQSVRISETLRNRFMENFQANDQLTLAVDQMQAALPFENDVARKKELQAEMENTLSQLADRGDYENLGFAVHKSARDFGQKYAPIKENYTRYQAALTDLNERYKKGEINSEQYQLSGAYIAKNYKGFEIDPTTGRVKDGSLFVAPTIVKDPKLMDLIKTRLEILHPDKYANTIKRVNWAEGEEGAIEVETTEGVEKIGLDKIQDVIQAVYAEPDVKAYVDQLADMKAYAGLKGQDIGTIVEGQTQSYLDGIAKLKEVISTGKLSKGDMAAYQEQINKYNKEIQTLAGITDEAGAHDYFKNKFREEILAPVTQYANKKAYTSQETSYKENWSARYLQDRADATKYPLLTRVGDVTAADRNGATLAAKKDVMAKNAANAQLYLEKAQAEGASEKIVAENMAAYNSLIVENEQIKQDIVNAANKVISYDDIKKQDEKAFETLKELYPSASPGELYLKIIETFDNSGDQDFLDFQNKYAEKYGKNYKFSQDVTAEVDKPLSGLEKGIASITVSPLGAAAPPNYTAYNAAQTASAPPLTFALALVTKFNREVNKQFSENKTSVPFEYGAIPTPNPKDGVAIRKAIDAYFVGKSLSANDMFTEMTEEGVERKPGSDYKEFKIEQVGWNDEHNIYELQVSSGEGDKKKVKSLHMDGSTLRNTDLDKLVNNPENKFASAVYKTSVGLEPGQVGKRTLFANTFDEKGVLKQVPLLLNVFAGESYGNSEVSFTMPNGAPYGIPPVKKLSNGEYELLDKKAIDGAAVVVLTDSDGKPLKNPDGSVKVIPKRMRMDEDYIKILVNGTIVSPSGTVYPAVEIH